MKHSDIMSCFSVLISLPPGAHVSGCVDMCQPTRWETGSSGGRPHRVRGRVQVRRGQGAKHSRTSAVVDRLYYSLVRSWQYQSWALRFAEEHAGEGYERSVTERERESLLFVFPDVRLICCCLRLLVICGSGPLALLTHAFSRHR